VIEREIASDFPLPEQWTYGPPDDDPYDDDPYDDPEPGTPEQPADAATPLLLPTPSNPMAVARALAPAWQHRGLLTMRSWHGTWMRWEGPHWVEIDDAAMRADLYPRLEHAQFRAVDKNGEPKILPWAPNRPKVANLIEAIAAITHLPSDIEVPSWLAAPAADSATVQVVACRNGLLDIATRVLQPLTPLYFNRVSVPFDYDAHAIQPTRWIGFLKTLWPDDTEAIAALQEFFGHIQGGYTDAGTLSQPELHRLGLRLQQYSDL